MPLRALVNGRAIQVWDLTREEWTDLRRHGRTGRAAVLMACCGAPGLPKTSRNGNPFFAHRTRSRPALTSCRWAGESAAHAACKLLAAAGARAAGWEVRTEVTAPGGIWRADVLCARGPNRVALEVQLARTAPGELTVRQERYRAAGVRGAWFIPAPFCPAPSQELPAFALETVGGAAEVRLGDPARAPEAAPALPLDLFVTRLLLGRVRFEEERLVRPLGCAVAVTAPDACRRCGGRFEHVAGVTNVAGAARPRYRLKGDVPLVALRELWEVDRRQAWSVASGVLRLRRGETRLSPLAPRRCCVDGAPYLTALCPGGGAAQGDGAVDRLRTSLHPQAPIRVPIPPMPLTFRPLDGRPPRVGLDDWRERVIPARWHLMPDGTASERVPDPQSDALWRAGSMAISARHERGTDHVPPA